MNDDLLDLLQRVSVLCIMLNEDVECKLIELSDELAEALLKIHEDVDDCVEQEILSRGPSNPESEL